MKVLLLFFFRSRDVAAHSFILKLFSPTILTFPPQAFSAISVEAFRMVCLTPPTELPVLMKEIGKSG
ncbi:hypothetical protein A9K65_021980 [Mesorhizobium sp. WSM1497]|uniref:hypothetical protein n=1 Tax=Mesorhizobium sp. WSM1497 TaxID=278153 RepID=UPI0007ECED7B|nr:hypothetical protein [Mesorhizobium sp. WSM1497]ARP65715.1 hypothetical protein A9K65_021980 [Mesorhizobium sp. WSM1497]